MISRTQTLSQPRVFSKKNVANIDTMVVYSGDFSACNKYKNSGEYMCQ